MVIIQCRRYTVTAACFSSASDPSAWPDRRDVFTAYMAHSVDHSIYRIVRYRVICNDLQLLQPLVDIMKRQCHFLI